MNTMIELHDSEVAEIASRDGAVVVRFVPACLHKSEGRPGFDSGSGWVQDVRLILHDASVSGDLPDLPCAVMGGELVVGGARHDNSMPVPFEAAECVELRLIFDEMHSATVAGRGVRLELLGEARYVEEFRP